MPQGQLTAAGLFRTHTEFPFHRDPALVRRLSRHRGLIDGAKIRIFQELSKSFDALAAFERAMKAQGVPPSYHLLSPRVLVEVGIGLVCRLGGVVPFVICGASMSHCIVSFSGSVKKIYESLQLGLCCALMLFFQGRAVVTKCRFVATSRRRVLTPRRLVRRPSAPRDDEMGQKRHKKSPYRGERR